MSERHEIQMSYSNASSALETFLRSMSLIKDNEVIVSWTLNDNFVNIIVGEEVSQ